MRTIERKEAENGLPVSNAASPVLSRWSTWLSPLRTSLPNSLPLAAVFVPAAAVLGLLASRVRDWLVMTDELQYAKLATHIGETLSPLPTVRGEHFTASAQLYPALIAPLYGWLSVLDAFRGALVLNGVLFASAAVPAYLLARGATLSRRWALVVAVLSIAVPWSSLTGLVMSESAAYPVFLWACVACLRAVAAPSPRRDVVALLALAVAVLARTQFIALGFVFVVAALIYRRRGHQVLAAASAAAIALAAVEGSRVLGRYADTAQHWPLPWRAFELAGAHLDEVGLGIALLPLLLGGAWIVANARRDPFALFALVAIVVLTLETSSFDVRFGGTPVTVVRDRYLFYLAPLILVAMARALSGPCVPRAALAATAWFIAITSIAYGYPRARGFYPDSPVAVVHDWIHPGVVAAGAVIMTLALMRVRWQPQVLAAVCVGFVFAGTSATAAVAWSRLLTTRSPSGREVSKPTPPMLNWVDAALPTGAHVALIPYATYRNWWSNARLWWDVEFWNKAVDDSLVIAGNWDYTPFDQHELKVDSATGVIAGTESAASYVVKANGDSRLQLDGRRVATNRGLELIQVVRPYRARWESTGLDPDGWTRPGRPARIHVFRGQSARVVVQRANGETTSICSKANVALPEAATGSVPDVPFDPTTSGVRTVGVRVVHVQTLRSCLVSAA